MKKLMNIRKNSKKGFTLIELIVVIVIIAILVAALTPAILGVIQRANRAADEADARTMMTVGSVAATMSTPPSTAGLNATDGPAAFRSAFGIGDTTTGLTSGTYNINFNGAFAYAVELNGGRLGTSVSPKVSIGNTDATPTSIVRVVIGDDGKIVSVELNPTT